MNYKILFFFSLLFIVTACGEEKKNSELSDEDRIDISKKEDEEKVYNPDLIKQYKSKLAALNKNNLKSANLALYAFEDWFKDENTETCDSAFFLFKEFYDNIMISNSDFDFSAIGIDEENMYTEEGELSAETKINIEKLEKQSFTVGQTEGMLYLSQYPKNVIKGFESKVSSPVRQFMKLTFRDVENPPTEDAGLAISPKELVDRMENWTALMDSFPKNSFAYGNCLNSAQFYRTCLFSNFLDNSYLYFETDESIEISEIHIEAFSYLKKNYPKSKNLKTTRKYIDLILKKKIPEAIREQDKFPHDFMLEVYGC
jgi:hypothetical protein